MISTERRGCVRGFFVLLNEDNSKKSYKKLMINQELHKSSRGMTGAIKGQGLDYKRHKPRDPHLHSPSEGTRPETSLEPRMVIWTFSLHLSFYLPFFLSYTLQAVQPFIDNKD